MFGKLLKLEKPKKPSLPAVEVADLDALVNNPISIKLHGKSHTMDPVDTLTYLQFTTQLHEIYALENPSKDEFIEKAHGLVSPLIPTITQEDIEQCTQTQIGALLNCCLKAVSGELHKDAAQKKNPMKSPARSQG